MTQPTSKRTRKLLSPFQLSPLLLSSQSCLPDLEMEPEILVWLLGAGLASEYDPETVNQGKRFKGRAVRTGRHRFGLNSGLAQILKTHNSGLLLGPTTCKLVKCPMTLLSSTGWGGNLARVLSVKTESPTPHSKHKGC